MDTNQTAQRQHSYLTRLSLMYFAHLFLFSGVKITLIYFSDFSSDAARRTTRIPQGWVFPATNRLRSLKSRQGWRGAEGSSGRGVSFHWSRLYCSLLRWRLSVGREHRSVNFPIYRADTASSALCLLNIPEFLSAKTLAPGLESDTQDSGDRPGHG